MEDSKRQTLHLMLEREQLNLENLRAASDNNNNRQKILKAESTIRILQEQLIHVRTEVSKLIILFSFFLYFYLNYLSLMFSIFVFLNFFYKTC